jgi:uncharacterized protein YndB with AHSA1/START domain
MSRFYVDKLIEINAPVSLVWRVFTDPGVTRQMGGDYVSTWDVGSSFGWKALDGSMLTQGVIMKIEPEKLLQHTLLNSVGATNSVITYELSEKDSMTRLHAREDFPSPISDDDYQDAAEGWDAALLALKDIAERQTR